MSRARRMLLAVTALSVAFVLFHGQLATAIVTRADDALRTGDVTTALRLYARARTIDPQSALAADRLAFYLAMLHERAASERAVAVAGDAIAHVHPDAVLFADRAFAEVQLRRWRDAERDFARAGTLAGDARYEHFAARMALHHDDRNAARGYAHRALAYDPAFAPARALLRAGR